MAIVSFSELIAFLGPPKSSAEAKYHAMASTTTELAWLMYLLYDIGLPHLKPVKLLCDDLSAIARSINPILCSQTIHIKLDYHFVKEKVTNGILVTCYLPCHKQIADVFTKPLRNCSFSNYWIKLGVHFLPLTTLQGTDKPHVKSDNKGGNE